MMRTILLAATFAALATTGSAAPKARPGPPPAAHPPKPPAAPVYPLTPTAADWRTPNPDDVMVIDTNKGRIVLELVPEAAPLNVERLKTLAHQNFYDGQTFFRVIEDFMDQTGDPQNTGKGGSTLPNVDGEFVFRRGADMPMTLVADQTVSEVGFVKSLPITSQSMMLAPMTKDQKVQAWGLYCAGVVGMARADDPNSANSQFFLMRGVYPALEKRYTAVGRVLSGMEAVRAIKLGEPAPDPQDYMERVRLLSDMPAETRPKVRVVDTAGDWFKGEIARKRAEKGATMSVCDLDVPAEVK